MGRSKNDINIKFKSFNGSQRVTGSAHVLEIKVNNKTTKILLDCGVIQEGKLSPKQSFDMNKLDVNMEDIGHVILSHAHL